MAELKPVEMDTQVRLTTIEEQEKRFKKKHCT